VAWAPVASPVRSLPPVILGREVPGRDPGPTAGFGRILAGLDPLRAPRSTGNRSARPVESPPGSVIVEHPFKGPDFLVRDILDVAGDAAVRLGCPLGKAVKRTVAARQTQIPDRRRPGPRGRDAALRRRPD